MGRRNLPAYERTRLALRLGAVIAKRAKANQGTRTDIPQNSAESVSPVDTRAEIAKIAGVSHDTVAAQESGEVRKKGGNYTSKVSDENLAPTLDDIGLSKEQIFEARSIRDAEQDDPAPVPDAGCWPPKHANLSAGWTGQLDNPTPLEGGGFVHYFVQSPAR